jgi:uncharacterized protein
MINTKLKEYVEDNIFPKYDSDKVDDGHKINHIKYVINRSLMFADQYNSEHPDDMLDLDKVYTIAAYHDVGLSEADRSVHEKRSAEMMQADEGLKQFFSEDDIQLMSEAVEDHRASLKTKPRTLYGQIVSQADRDTSAEHFLKRTYDFRKNKEPFSSDFEAMKSDIRQHFVDKYGENGYGLSKIWFPDKDFDNFKNTVRSWINNDDLLTDKLKALIKYNNEREGKQSRELPNINMSGIERDNNYSV